MIYVGIDAAKTTHYAAASDSDGIVLIYPFITFIISSKLLQKCEQTGFVPLDSMLPPAMPIVV